jgi:hypothetical protein
MAGLDSGNGCHDGHQHDILFSGMAIHGEQVFVICVPQKNMEAYAQKS